MFDWQAELAVPATVTIPTQTHPSPQVLSDTVSTTTVPVPPKSFATTLAGQSSKDKRPYPIPCLKGDALSIRIG